MQFSLKPRVFAFSVLAVMTIEFIEFLFAPSHLKHESVSSVDNDLDEKYKNSFDHLMVLILN